MTRTYYLDWSPMFRAFINERKVDGYQIINDSDVLMVRFECHNDTAFALLMLEYAQWLENAQHDKTLNPNADGSMYHRAKPQPVQW